MILAYCQQINKLLAEGILLLFLSYLPYSISQAGGRGVVVISIVGCIGSHRSQQNTRRQIHSWVTPVVEGRQLLPRYSQLFPANVSVADPDMEREVPAVFPRRTAATRRSEPR